MTVYFCTTKTQYKHWTVYQRHHVYLELQISDVDAITCNNKIIYIITCNNKSIRTPVSTSRVFIRLHCLLWVLPKGLFTLSIQDQSSCGKVGVCLTYLVLELCLCPTPLAVKTCSKYFCSTAKCILRVWKLRHMVWPPETCSLLLAALVFLMLFIIQHNAFVFAHFNVASMSTIWNIFRLFRLFCLPVCLNTVC